MLKEKEMNKTFPTLGSFFPLSTRHWTNVWPGPSSGRSDGALLVAGREHIFSRPQSSVPLFTCSSWKHAGPLDAATMDEEQMRSQTKVSVAWRG